ncbi:MAG: tRNA (adenosine(37)-N6)-threonylcarbamoyltransferase complex ATPase subunit type 1 TsaE [Sedimentisphaerales bacterium]|nr:tRNA (adenosine(37)-N6)-threonylcarbamoyltransferase complex ATPase subunit type 1 TsaE [Sedimentisphaerales bacterium]
MSTGKFEFVSKSTGQTIALGKKIGAALSGGEVFCLIGELGSGKTHLIKGIAAGAGATDTKHVNSPTFVIVNEYSGPGSRLDIYHIDAYRLESIAEFEGLGFDDLCYEDSVVLIEWADKVMSALSGIDPIIVELTHVSENERRIVINDPPSSLANILKSAF